MAYKSTKRHKDDEKMLFEELKYYLKNDKKQEGSTSAERSRSYIATLPEESEDIDKVNHARSFMSPMEASKESSKSIAYGSRLQENKVLNSNLRSYDLSDELRKSHKLENSPKSNDQ